MDHGTGRAANDLHLSGEDRSFSNTEDWTRDGQVLDYDRRFESPTVGACSENTRVTAAPRANLAPP